MKRVISLALALVLSFSVLTGCGETKTNTDGANKGTTTATEQEALKVLFWSAPNQNQFDYWQKKAVAFNEAGIQYEGKTIQVSVEMTPETVSSEAAIQNAIATGTAPAVSENISLSLMNTLAESGVIYELQDETIYKQIVQDRAMGNLTDSWELDGKQYVIPLYINSVCLVWNTQALHALGFQEPPKTVEEYHQVIQAYVDHKQEMEAMGVMAALPGSKLVSESAYQCGYDFQMLYSTFTQGGEWLQKDALTVDRDAMIKTLEFWGALGNTNELNAIESPWTQEKISVLFDIGKPWNLESYDEAGKVYKEDYVFAPVPVLKEGDSSYCYADTKGITFYKTSNISEEVHHGALEFIGWVYNEENAVQSDLDWINATGMLPVRSDMTENKEFDSAFSERPALSFFAGNIPNAVPLPAFTSAGDVEVAFRTNGLIPYITEAVNHEALDTVDASEYADRAIAAMKAAGKFN